MAHEWHRGVLAASSWHGLEKIGVMATSDDLIRHGETSGAYPTALTREAIVTASGLTVPGHAIVAHYASHPPAALSVVGDRYRATACTEWRDLVRAVCLAGGHPTGAFSLRDGTRTLATFEVGKSNGLKTHFLLADAFDGSMSLTAGMSSVRVVCANTLSSALSSDGRAMATLRHTASLETKVRILVDSIADAVQRGDSVRAAYERAEQTRLTSEQAQAIFDRLFPPPAEDEKDAAKTRVENVRADARRAMARPENNVGPTLATVWNAATWMVDRTADGKARPVRGGGDRLDSLLFGGRADRVSEIQTMIEVILKDGTVEAVPAARALEIGADAGQVGRKVLDDMLADLPS
jgi:Domain of unknown function (DUF932)